jgi:outer membrane protein assembly factor BamB
VRTINRTRDKVSLGTVWAMLDGYTGYTICYVANVSTAGTLVYGKRGEILRFNIVNYGTTQAPKYYLTCFNLSDGTMVASTQPPTGTGAWQWRPAGGHFGAANPFLGAYATNYVHDGNDFYTLNVSIPDIRKLSPILNQTGTIQAVRDGEYIIIGAPGRNDERGLVEGYLMTLSLKKGEEGKLLSYITFKPPFASYMENATVSFTGVYPEYGVFCFHSTRLLKRWGYSLETGEMLWEGIPEEPFQYYSMNTNVYQGLLLSYGYGGQLRAYNITTGKIVWMYNATGVGFEGDYGGYYTIGIAAICDGKIYTVASEHSPTQPLWRGPNLRCIDAKTGKEIWSILFWGAGMSPASPNVAMADGILVALNYFDMELYAFGKGPSATTVSAPQEEIPLGSSVLITGTVTDQTPYGRRNTNGELDFTLKGTPAIADECMGRWMEYLFMQQAYPSDIKGVDVTLDAIDPDGKYINLGRATCDATGKFTYAFKPEKQGIYKIIATFEGSASYGPSFATTYLYVGPHAVATAEQAQAAQAEIEALQQSIQPLITALIVIVVVCICLVAYEIHISRKMLRQVVK